jgi:hypothetical protein
MKRLSILTICLGVATMAGCDKSGNNEENKPVDVSADVKYTVNDGADMVTLFDVAVEYTDATGTKSETITSLPWSKQIHVAKIPFDATMKVTYTAKSSYAQKDVYTTGFAGGIGYKTSDGRLVSFTGSVQTPIPVARIAEYVAKYNGTTKEHTANITPAE